MEETKEIKLNLACGKDYREGYINIDNQSMFQGKVDKKANVLSLKWKNNSVDEILLSHFMMYVRVLEAPMLLARWHGWLKEGGKLIIETGDLKKLCKTILESNDPKVINGTNGVMQMFGWAETVGHKWCWCADTLVPLLNEIGFKTREVIDGGLHNRPERDITIIATK